MCNFAFCWAKKNRRIDCTENARPFASEMANDKHHFLFVASRMSLTL